MNSRFVRLLTGFPAVLIAMQTNIASADVLFCCNNPTSNNALKWNDPNITFKMTTVWTWGLQPVVDAAAMINTTLHSAINLTVVNDDDSSVTSNGDGNEIHWSTGAGPNPGTLAVTTTRYSLCSECDSWTCGGSSCTPGRINEADVVFFEKICVPQLLNPAVCSSAPPVPRNWTDYPVDVLNATGAANADIHTVASHELLHAVGLAHASNGFARMESHFPNGGWFHGTLPPGQRSAPLAQDSYELGFLYPGAEPTTVNVVATNFQHNGLPPEPNSTMTWGHSAALSFFNALSPDLFPTTFAGLINPAVARIGRAGDSVFVRACAQNLGPATWGADLAIAFRFSPDAVIDATDTVTPDNFAWVANTITGYADWCSDFEIHVPAVSPGVYFIGYNIFNDFGSRSMVLNHTFEVQP